MISSARPPRLFLALLFVPALAAAAALPRTEELRARMVLEAFRRAYPQRIEAVEWVDGDWTVAVGGERFFWAHGRLLPPAERDSWGSYKPYVFYAYPASSPDPSSYSEQKIAELRRQGEAEVRKNGVDHHPGFRAALYGGGSRADVEASLDRATLFGTRVSVHADIREAVERVDAAVRAEAARDPDLAAFLKTLGSIGGYNWREIRGTTRRSFHSWGLAVDIQPRRLGGAAIFWEWERARNEDWMLVPLQARWAPHPKVIEAFEDEGFIWGGKWDFYDNMHFEYRPELHELTRVFTALGGLGGFDPALQEPPPGVGGGELERRF